MNKKAIGLVLVGVIAGSSITAFAAGGRKIEVFDNVKKVVVNKINKPFTKGEEPFTYNGRTYVPLRYVSEALGENVDWDGKTGTVYIGDRYGSNSKFWSTDINYSKWDEYYTDFKYSHGNPSKYVTSNMGNRYENYLAIYAPSAYRYFGELTFPLNGQYKEFKGILGCTDRYKTGSAELMLTVLLDGKEAYKKKIVTGMLEEPIKINTTGALNITFKVQGNQEKEQKLEMGIFNGEFIKK